MAVADRVVPAPVSVALLGGFLLEVGSRAVDVPVASQRVAAFVALHDRPVARTTLAGSLWRDTPESRAMGNLRSALWRLNLGPAPVVAATASHVAMAEGVRVDVDDLSEQVETVMSGNSSDEELAHLALPHMELLPGWYDEWVLLERERLRQLALHGLEALCRALAKRRRYARSIEVGLRAVALDPLRESAHRAVVAAHLAEGNSAEALRQFELYRRLVMDALGLGPSAKMLELVAPARRVTVPLPG